MQSLNTCTTCIDWRAILQQCGNLRKQFGIIEIWFGRPYVLGQGWGESNCSHNGLLVDPSWGKEVCKTNWSISKDRYRIANCSDTSSPLKCPFYDNLVYFGLMIWRRKFRTIKNPRLARSYSVNFLFQIGPLKRDKVINRKPRFIWVGVQF